MHWVIQNNLFNEQGFHRLLRVMEALELPHTLVKVIPFDGGVEPHVEADNPIIVMGTITLGRYSGRFGWSPGYYSNKNFDFRVWKDKWKILNSDSSVGRFGDIPFREGSFFVRPCLDNKAFTGTAFEGWNAFTDWTGRALDATRGIEDVPWVLSPNTPVAVSNFKQIQQEYRLMIVDGRVVTGSLYKENGRARAHSLVDDDVLSFGQEMAGIWGPAEAYALDICRSEDELYVLEVNCINSSGFYECDVGKMVVALEKLNAKR